MDTLWLLLELANLLLFTAVIVPRQQPAAAKPLLPIGATQFLRLTWVLPILAFGVSLFFDHQVTALDWLCLAIAIMGNALVIKGKRDLGSSHTWAGFYLPGARIIRSGIFQWVSHPMYIGIVAVIVSCSLVYIVRLPGYISAAALICCLYIVAFLMIAAFREQRVLHQTNSA
ncbi:hypothetical protein MUU49_14850 [Scandinavium goeteborgense]|uniref:methyltransferase n=1 Tax=Scandinavium goeteborgense TaxID=1851514 RepID=UPI00216637B8|nr:methyltransferase [Scandinavium goeteborgense]MCS2153835.1 hypothetical protein [Scandinavium goeteborgense]